MPQRNMRGGKAFKKGSKGKARAAAEAAEAGGTAGRFEAPDRDQGVDYARVLRTLGNRRLLCFCNDGMERVCKIRGALCRGRRRTIIHVGDIVLVSYRLFDGDGGDFNSDSDSEEREGDAAGAGAVSRLVAGTGRGVTEATASTAPTAGAAILASGSKDVADVVHKYEQASWRQIRKENGLHPQLFIITAEGGAGAGASAGAAASNVLFTDELQEESSGEDEEGEGGESATKKPAKKRAWKAPVGGDGSASDDDIDIAAI
jgi:initiation factor 1A